MVLRKVLPLCLVSCVLASLASIVSASDAADFAGHWEGEIAVAGSALGVKIDLAHDGGSWSGTIDIPMQGAAGLPLEIRSVEGEKIVFAIAGIPGNPTFEGTLEGTSIQGTFKQGSLDTTFELSSEKKLEMPERPQEPKPPFPYEIEDVTYESGEITLAGTLTVPAGEGPFPAVLLLTGSGPQDRDETIFGHKPFWVIADRLTRSGIAVLRVDDRGVGDSGGSIARSTLEDFADDALVGVAFLKTRTKIDPERIGLLGHSEGGIVAPLAASRSSDVAFVVLLAGTGVPGIDVISEQTGRMLRTQGVPEGVVENQLRQQRRVNEIAASDISAEAVEAEVRAIAAEQLAAAPGIDETQFEQQLQAQIKELTSPWLRFFLSHDPRPALRKVKVPVLALNGGLDLQVVPEQNMPEIEAALKGNPDVTAKVLPGLNHLFQKAETGKLSEYAQIEQTISPEVLDLVKEWILERFGPGAG